MRFRLRRIMVLSRCTFLLAILLQQCVWFQPNPIEAEIIKPVPVDGYSGISRRIHYPKTIREQGIEGEVIINAKISETGDVSETRVGQKLEPELDRIASNAIQRTRFTPALRGGEPESVWISIPIIFALKDWQNKETPFADFKMDISPNPSYENYQVEIHGVIKPGFEMPLRFECLLPFNVDQSWVKNDDGLALDVGLVRDESGEWIIFESKTQSFTLGFNYLPLATQEKYKFQYKFVMNHSLPPWELSVLYPGQTVRFSQKPDRTIKQVSGVEAYIYEQDQQSAFEPRYLEIERID